MDALRDGDKIRCGRCQEGLGHVQPGQAPNRSHLALPPGYVRKTWPERWLYQMPESRRKRYLRGETVEHHRKQRWHLDGMGPGEWRWSGPPVAVGLAVVKTLLVQVACANCTSRNDIQPWA